MLAYAGVTVMPQGTSPDSSAAADHAAKLDIADTVPLMLRAVLRTVKANKFDTSFATAISGRSTEISCCTAAPWLSVFD
jgi:hypothetical protein